MPHLSLEYSANLEGRLDIAGLAKSMHAAMLDAGLFELGAIRVRAYRADVYAIADLLAENAFVDITLRIGEGRSDDEKERAGAILFKAAEEELAPLFATPHFALSLEIREINRRLSWKRNAIHPRLRPATGGAAT